MVTWPHSGAAQIWRDGSPTPYNPDKAQIRDWGGTVETEIDALAGSSLIDSPAKYLAVGDGVTDDQTAMQDFFTAGGGRITAMHVVSGQLDTVSGLDVTFANGALLKPTAPSVTGSFITNVTSTPATRAQADIRIVNAQIDGTDYLDPVDFAIAGGTTTTITLPAGASATDDFYNGLFVQFLSGANANGNGYRTITDYNGTSKVATLSAAITAPAAGDHVLIGYNDNALGFAWGAERVAILGGHVRNFPATMMVPPVFGGKGVNFEQGVIGGVIDGLSVENCHVGVYVAGTAGTHSTGASKETTGIRLANLRASNCGAALAVANLDLADGISGDGDEQEVTISGLTYRDCGHAPWRIVGVNHEKSGAVALMGANGVTLTNVRGYNSPSYPASYPADYASRCGYGLSGPIGAALWGHGRNVTICDFHHYGDADAAVHIGRCRALGDDAPSSGQVTQALGWMIHNLNIHGTVDRVVSRDETLGFDETQVSGYWQIVVDTVTTGFVPTTFESGEYLTLDITERATGKRVIGTPKDILIRGNTFADYPAGLTDLRVLDHRKLTIADDGVASFTPLMAHGIMEFATSSTALSNLVRYRTGATPQTALFLTTTNQAVTTGALTGATGTDGNFTVSAHTDGKIYIENRRGASLTVDVWLKRG